MKTKMLLAFVGGAVVGSIVTGYLLREKYEALAQEEIDSVKETFARMAATEAAKEDDVRKKAEAAKEKPDILEYAARLRKEGYTSYAEGFVEKSPDENSGEVPYVISPDEFGELEDYAKISLNYFADGVVTDDDYEIVDDIENIIGLASLTHFGEYEEDSVFVRNDRTRCDYEILRDYRTFAEVKETIPHSEEEE